LIKSGAYTSGDYKLARSAAETALELEPERPSTIVMLGNIYAATQDYDSRNKLLSKMKISGLSKKPGISSIDVGDKVNHLAWMQP
jgi:uncharacterized membrane-anchored protein